MVTLQTAAKLNARRLSRFLQQAQRAAGVRGDVEVLVTGNRRMQELNRTFRAKNSPTDVLAFPGSANGRGAGGDIAISAVIAARNARQLGHSLEEEVKVLLLHGMLHLAGHDHERDSGEMARREQRLRRELRLPLTLTERASSPKKNSAGK